MIAIENGVLNVNHLRAFFPDPASNTVLVAFSTTCRVCMKLRIMSGTLDGNDNQELFTMFHLSGECEWESTDVLAFRHILPWGEIKVMVV